MRVRRSRSAALIVVRLPFRYEDRDDAGGGRVHRRTWRPRCLALDPRRGLVGSYVWLEAHCRRRAAAGEQVHAELETTAPVRRAAGRRVEVHYDFGRLELPDESTST